MGGIGWKKTELRCEIFFCRVTHILSYYFSSFKNQLGLIPLALNLIWKRKNSVMRRRSWQQTVRCTRTKSEATLCISSDAIAVSKLRCVRYRRQRDWADVLTCLRAYPHPSFLQYALSVVQPVSLWAHPDRTCTSSDASRYRSVNLVFGLPAVGWDQLATDAGDWLLVS
jgi:hypothetical protein